jgi:hypothetical protein
VLRPAKRTLNVRINTLYNNYSFKERYSKMVRDKDEIELCWKALENKMEELHFS